MDKLLDERGSLFAEYLGQELKGAIRSRGYTQTEVADGTGHSRPSMSNWLNNKPSIPIEVAEKVCTYIGVSFAEIVDRADDRVRKELGPWPPISINPDALTDEEKARIAMGKLNRGDLDIAANHDPDKEAEEDYDPDAGA